MQNNPLQMLVSLQKAGNLAAIPSYCTANGLVLEALLRQAKRFDRPILIEATANQVNQFGGYTGMQPKDFADFVYLLAEKVGFPRERILLGGDHLGPLTWAKEAEESAMQKACELVRLFVLAGYKKIHLDTSMRLGTDLTDKPLTDETIAARGARLYAACEEAYNELHGRNPEEMHPAFIIGSEVPIPGGATEAEDTLSVTSPEALSKTVSVYRRVFAEAGFPDAFRHIVGVVVQPGVEFGDDAVFDYNRDKAAELCACARAMEGIVLEGHSTDYQTAKNLRKMAEDGICILKVGPAVTFALREGLFALNMMQKILLPAEKVTDFEEILEQTMLESPDTWKRHYHGGEHELWIKRRYSFSDRCRYSFSEPAVAEAMEKLLEGLKDVEIPLSLLHQYMPRQYLRVREGILPCEARALLMDYVTLAADDYNYAAGYLKGGEEL